MTSPSRADTAHYGIFTTKQALLAGHTKGFIRQRLASGDWLAVRRGLYVVANDATAVDRSRLELAAALGAMSPDVAASHWSAANLLGIQTLESSRTIWVTRPPTSGNGCHILPGVRERAASLPPHHVTIVDALRTTTGARTVVDLARMSTLAGAVVCADSALRIGGTTMDELLEVARECRTWPGGAKVLRTLQFADGRAESPLESLSRLAFARMHLPVPELQVPISDAYGLIGRVDFYWSAHRTIGEADGRLKYQQPEALWEEKRREDRLRAAGFEMVRWSSNDIRLAPLAVHQRILAAFDRGDRR